MHEIARLARRWGGAAGAALILCLASSAVAQTAPTQQDAARAAIDRLRADFQRAVEAGDWAALGAMMHPDAVMVPPGAPGWVELAKSASGGPFPAGVRMDIQPREVMIMSPEWAYEFGNTTIRHAPPDGRAPVELRDTYLVIFRNRGDGWKLYREVASASLPPPAPEAAAR